ncbi:hypothetical protein LXL04_005763 [Taraxacum kok-saghyz]
MNRPPDLPDNNHDNQFSHGSGFIDYRGSDQANKASNSHPSYSFGTGDYSIGNSDPNMKKFNPDLPEIHRKQRFSFSGLVKTEEANHGNSVLPSAKLIDNSPFESTLYTNSINQIAKLTRIPEISVSSAVSSDNTKLNADKIMDVDSNGNNASNPTDRDIFGSFLDLNPDFREMTLKTSFDKHTGLQSFLLTLFLFVFAHQTLQLLPIEHSRRLDYVGYGGEGIRNAVSSSTTLTEPRRGNFPDSNHRFPFCQRPRSDSEGPCILILISEKVDGKFPDSNHRFPFCRRPRSEGSCFALLISDKVSVLTEPRVEKFPDSNHQFPFCRRPRSEESRFALLISDKVDGVPQSVLPREEVFHGSDGSGCVAVDLSESDLGFSPGRRMCGPAEGRDSRGGLVAGGFAGRRPAEMLVNKKSVKKVKGRILLAMILGMVLGFLHWCVKRKKFMKCMRFYGQSG